MTSMKIILKYICGTNDYGLLYSNMEGALVGYCDTDWAGSSEDRKSTSDRCFFSWKQSNIMV